MAPAWELQTDRRRPMTACAGAPDGEIDAVLALVERVESSLARGRRAGSERPAADELVARVTRMLGALRDAPEPSDATGRHTEADADADADAAADAELLAALHVFRNAAFAFRRMADATGSREAALASACLGMIQQGHDHLDRFRRASDT